MKRKEFIKTSALAAAGVMMFPACMQAEKKSGIGLQLYTLRDSIFKDPKGVLKQVADFGYEKLETFAYGDGKIYGMQFSEFGDYIKGLGMKVTSGHYPIDLANSDKWKKAVEDAKSIGQEYMVVPYLQEDQRKTLDDYKKVCGILNKAGEVCTENDIRFGYHNHAFEFETLEGQVPYDLMLNELDQKHVGMELDIYWVVRAGKDPHAYFEKYPGRFEQWHVKDMDKDNKARNADVGTGTIDWKAVFAKAKQSGMKHFYIEHDSFPGSPIDSVSAGIKNLKTIL